MSNIQVVDLIKVDWAFFEKAKRIKDAIRKKEEDRYGVRFGFIKCHSREDASMIVKLINGNLF